ncbi:MAG: DUF4270 family protein [Flammeovirgaceae bacterium]
MINLSCNEGGEVGLNFFNQEDFEVSSIDTLTLAVSTVLFDSVTTHNGGNVLVGRHQDQKLGTVRAKGYFRPGEVNFTGLIQNDPNLEDDAVFDSLSIVLDYTGYSIYDTLTTQTIAIHLASETIELDDDNALYNTSKFPYEAAALAHLSFSPQPLKDDSIEMRLPDEMGQDLFAFMEQGELNDYIDQFTGLVLVPAENDNAAILGFSTSSKLRVYYHVERELEVEEYTFDLPLGNTHFTEVASDRSGTKLATLLTQREHLNATFTDQEAYIQSGVGLALRVEVPYLTRLRETESLIVSRAYLQFRPTADQESTNVDLPTNISMFEVNHRNEILTYWGDFTTLKIDDEFNRETYYQTDITAFVEKQLSEVANNENALLFEIGSTSASLSLDRLYVGDTQAEKEMRLLVYYIKVQ